MLIFEKCRYSSTNKVFRALYVQLLHFCNEKRQISGWKEREEVHFFGANLIHVTAGKPGARNISIMKFLSEKILILRMILTKNKGVVFKNYVDRKRWVDSQLNVLPIWDHP